MLFARNHAEARKDKLVVKMRVSFDENSFVTGGECLAKALSEVRTCVLASDDDNLLGIHRFSICPAMSCCLDLLICPSDCQAEHGPQSFAVEFDCFSHDDEM